MEHQNDKKENKEETGLIVAAQRGLALRSLNDMYLFAQYVVDSQLAPRSFQTPAQVLIAIQTGAELAMLPMRSLQSLCVVGGQARLWGDAPLAMVRDSGLLEYIDESIEGTSENMVATCVTKRKGDPKEKVTTFSVADAKCAGLWNKKGTWQDYPKRMLTYRARSFNLRDNFPDVLAGCSIAEEYEGVEFAPIETGETKLGVEGLKKRIESKEVEKGNKAAAEFEHKYNLGEEPEKPTSSPPPQPTQSQFLRLSAIKQALIEKAVDASVLSSRRELEKEEKDALLNCIWNRLGGKWPTSKKDEEYCIAEIRLNDFLFKTTPAGSPGGKDAGAKESDAGDPALKYYYKCSRCEKRFTEEEGAKFNYQCPSCYGELNKKATNQS